MATTNKNRLLTPEVLAAFEGHELYSQNVRRRMPSASQCFASATFAGISSKDRRMERTSSSMVLCSDLWLQSMAMCLLTRWLQSLLMRRSMVLVSCRLSRIRSLSLASCLQSRMLNFRSSCQISMIRVEY